MYARISWPAVRAPVSMLRFRACVRWRMTSFGLLPPAYARFCRDERAIPSRFRALKRADVTTRELRESQAKASNYSQSRRIAARQPLLRLRRGHPRALVYGAEADGGLVARNEPVERRRCQRRRDARQEEEELMIAWWHTPLAIQSLFSVDHEALQKRVIA